MTLGAASGAAIGGVSGAMAAAQDPKERAQADAGRGNVDKVRVDMRVKRATE